MFLTDLSIKRPVVATVIPGPIRAVDWKHPFKKKSDKNIKVIFIYFINFK